jgi:hypothetical protein
MRSGKYIITIKNGGKHIQGSPFICRVYSKFIFRKKNSSLMIFPIDKLNESRTILSTMYETENDIGNETTTGTTTQVTSSCNSLIPIQSALNPVRSSTTSTNHVDLDILRSSMTGDASQVCVFGTGLYEAKPRRKATFKIDASQAGLYYKINSFDLLII